MVTYLSDDWVTALDAALAATSPVAAGPGVPAEPGPPGVTVEYRVEGGPHGERRWHLSVGPEGTRAAAGSPATPAAVTFTQSWDTAVGVARGERSAQEALLSGDVKVGGDPASLLGWREALSAAQDRMAQLVATTDFTG
jgi:hypothetical protein